MPLYDYKCNEHGVFSELTTIAKMEDPVDCPQCGVVSPRILALPPHIVTMMKETKQAMERNEKAQHEPIISTLDRRTNDKKHASDCGCSTTKKSNLFYTARGQQDVSIHAPLDDKSLDLLLAAPVTGAAN